MNFFSKYDYDSLFGHFGNGITDKHEFMKGKVNSVQEACAKCFAVHILNLKSSKSHEKIKQRTSNP